MAEAEAAFEMVWRSKRELVKAMHDERIARIAHEATLAALEHARDKSQRAEEELMQLAAEASGVNVTDEEENVSDRDHSSYTPVRISGF